MQQIEGEDDEVTKKMSNIVVESENDKEEIDIPDLDDIPDIEDDDGVVEEEDPVNYCNFDFSLFSYKD